MAGRAEITSAEGRGITGNLPNDFDNSKGGKHMARPYSGAMKKLALATLPHVRKQRDLASGNKHALAKKSAPINQKKSNGD